MLKSIESIEDDRLVAKCYVELGDVAKEKGEYDESLYYHRRSLEIYERIADTLCVADSHLNIAAVYKAKGELKHAMCEYEKGLALYEDVMIDDALKNSDSGVDVSLSSSCFSDRQHTRTLSKSDDNLSQSTFIDFIDKDMQQTSNDATDMSVSASDLFFFPVKKCPTPSTTHTNDSFVHSPESVTHELLKVFSSSHASDIDYINENETLSSRRSSDRVCETALEENHILTRFTLRRTPVESINQDLLVLNTEPSRLEIKTEEINNYDKSATIDKQTRPRYYSLKKNLLIIILSILLVAIFFWFQRNTPVKTTLSCPSNTFSLHKNSRSYHGDDLNQQLRKFLPLQKAHIQSLPKNKRRTIEAFLTNSKNRTKITVEKFQQILDMLDLKILLIPK
ncbi:unnamed protein product [Rotaria magnacalcarata]|uniref:Tetratricopeptide repeat protein n=2 Tax=Rotaria magnacalcarata TaxID=392030 RepID=A0A814YPT2_9BILA|nr:unnamed protein product [Rotaria magnacalcarata]